MSERSYKIVSAAKDGDRLIVDARFYESGEEVGRINQGFPVELSENEIEEEIRKACETFFGDLRLAAEEKIKAEEDKKTQEKIDNLIGKESDL
ncbi:hypothetical protein HZA85_01360 [Candidatus Uhrbacteria bacterium]|nr:hypothetical protein [Candidatus Uhrbacteria bacterium]